MEAVRLRIRGYLLHTETNYGTKEATGLGYGFKHQNSTWPLALIRVTTRSVGAPTQVLFWRGMEASYRYNLIFLNVL